MMKVLNLRAGLGGNRKEWKGVDVTAVENDEDIARFYRDHFPEDELFLTDAHQYLIDNYKKFDFIWNSPVCTTHSRVRYFGWKNINPVYPDFTLYEEIVFLQHHAECKWVVENVVPYYEPLIPGKKVGRHMFWSNFKIGTPPTKDGNVHKGVRKDLMDFHGIDITGYSFEQRTDKILRNCVHPEIGKYILERAKGIYRKSNDKQLELIQGH